MYLQPLLLNEDFRYALKSLEESRKSLFVTGRAGTGKSTLLQLFRNTTRKKLAVLAPTGVAALNVQGQTIHSFFGFAPKMLTKNDIQKRYDRRVYQSLDILIIDEISMVRADMLDNIDYFLRINRENPLPFGGVQMIFFGDLYQLPPVVSSEEEKKYFQTVYQSPFFFSAKVLEAGFLLETLELHKVYRQSERHFIRLLDAIRTNRIDGDDLEDLNERHQTSLLPDAAAHITLCARNATADGINEKKLLQLDTTEFKYLSAVTGEFNPLLFPAEAVLRLKVGAQVMFVKNDLEKQFVNGTLGRVTRLTEEQIFVETEEKEGIPQLLEVRPAQWEIIRYKPNESEPTNITPETIGTFTQYPLRLAWAITIHKSQGKTFDRIMIDLGAGAFEHGQTYVALSRCRTLGGIVLRQPLRLRDVMTDDRVVEFMRHQVG